MMKILFDMTIYLSITTLIILLIKNVFKNKMQAKLQLYIWAILLIRLIVPALPESKISVYNTIPEIKYERGVETIREDMYQKMRPIINYPPLPKNRPDVYVASIWVGFGVLLLAYFIGIYISFSLKTRKMPICSDEKIIDILSSVKNELNINKEIKVISGGNTPMLKGFIKPVIILPDIYDENEIRDIFYHELCHLKYGDMFIIWLATFLLCINWYNPIIWYAFFTIRRDIELACDERVLKYTQNRQEYARLLLKTSLLKNKFILGTTALQNGEKQITKRIKFIASFKKPKVYLSVLSLVIVLLVSGVCLTNSVKKDNSKNLIGTVVESLYDIKTPYVGNASAVGKIIGSLPYSEGLEYINFEVSTEPHRGVIVNYKKAVKEYNPENMFKNAKIMFALIDNLDEITFTVDGENHEFSRADEAKYTNTKEEFDEFLKIVEGLTSDSKAPKLIAENETTEPEPEFFVDESEAEYFSFAYTTYVEITEEVAAALKAHPKYERISNGTKLNISDYIGKTLEIGISDPTDEKLGNISIMQNGEHILVMSADKESVQEVVDEISKIQITEKARTHPVLKEEKKNGDYFATE